VRIILPGALFLAASALLGCSSPSVPSWAVATSKSPYVAEKHLVERARPEITSVARQNDDAEVDDRKIIDAKIYNVKVDDPASTGSTLPADDPRIAFRELDRRQAEENRNVDAALSICRC
jgi:hypothetical protein